MLIQMVNTLIQSFGGNVGIGTKSTTYALDVYTGTSSFETLSTTEISVGGIPYAHIPSGMIAMWSGAIDPESIPQGWSLCDGSGTTPDLRERFILGYGTTFSTVGASGGSFQKTITAPILANHTHTTNIVTTANDHTHSSGSSSGPHSHQGGTQGGGHNHSWNANNTSHEHTSMNAGGGHGHTMTGQAGQHLHYNYIIDTRNCTAGYTNTGGSASWWAVTNVTSYALSNRQTIQGGTHNHSMNIYHNHQHSVHQHYHNTGPGSHNHPVAQSGGHTHNSTAGGSHQHTSTTGTTGSPTAVNVDLKPLYYVLAYIIKD